MQYKLARTPTYRFSADHLGPLATLELRLAERLIRSGPERLRNTLPVSLGGRAVTLFGFGDLAIYFEARPDRAMVSLYLVVDAKNLPDWFIHPTGTWFEDIDLT